MERRERTPMLSKVGAQFVIGGTIAVAVALLVQVVWAVRRGIPLRSSLSGQQVLYTMLAAFGVSGVVALIRVVVIVADET